METTHKPNLAVMSIARLRRLRDQIDHDATHTFIGDQEVYVGWGNPDTDKADLKEIRRIDREIELRTVRGIGLQARRRVEAWLRK